MAGLLPEGEIQPLGKHALKDIDEPQAIYGLRTTAHTSNG
jgi:hypothetical protein